MQTEEQQVWETLVKLDQALVQKNAGVFNELLSADFVGAIPTGASFPREAYIRHHCDNPFGLVSLVEEGPEAASIRVYDHTAIVNRRAHAHFKTPGGDLVEYDVQRLEVLRKVNGQWKLASGQGTRVMKM